MHETWLGPLRPPRGAPRDASLAAEARVTEHPLSARAAPRPAGRRRLQRPELYYVGRRPAATEVHIVSRTELEPLPHLNYQSGVPFDWGLLDSGRAGARLRHACAHHREPANEPCLPNVLRRDRGVPGPCRFRAQPRGRRAVADDRLLGCRTASTRSESRRSCRHGLARSPLDPLTAEASMSASNVMALDLVACGSRHGRAGTGSPWRSTPCFRLPAVVTYF
jgi:hypothetical protein